ncbi:hypothetical protein SeMB42_g01232 [Synchytrium endobioticum]|uniref:DNA primase large subunit n=1 Tax=Synchytrium endobioticum TaxID=286115 RepID=A0A507DGS5_9FUNG|nr:hypothetical protein SeLEV6574_g00708 [Synchytrium endobioticum]TPX52693.1 hypothetical protein SeMB42_g01232 [Synchytrium endobioticum]
MFRQATSSNSYSNSNTAALLLPGDASVAASSIALPGPYPYRLNLYRTPPSAELTLHEFETFALDRLQLLKALESCLLRNKKDDETKDYVDRIAKKYLPLGSNHLANAAKSGAYGQSPHSVFTILDQERRKDHFSHFILRLAYCRSHDLRNWFLKHETLLFRMRLKAEDKDTRDAWLKREKFAASALEIVAADEKASLLRDLAVASGAAASDDEVLRHETIYKVPFEIVPDLVAKRRVLVRCGYAYVPEREHTALIVNQFRDMLKADLEATARALPTLDEGDRLIPILTSIGNQYLGPSGWNETSAAGVIKADDVEKLVQHFPLCMRNLHAHLRADSHLKHGGRLQYGLFLKGIGLPLEEALVFWRRAFAKKMDDSTFNKNHLYNVRYNYGLEGQKKDWSPYACMKIITQNQPGSGDNHGCPYRHFSPDLLKSQLVAAGVPDTNVDEILTLSRNQHYTIACTRVFELTKPKAVKAENDTNQKEVMETITHPNMYFNLSYRGTAGKYGRKPANNLENGGQADGSENDASTQPMEGDLAPLATRTTTTTNDDYDGAGGMLVDR